MTKKLHVVADSLTVSHHLGQVSDVGISKKSLTPSSHLGTLGSGGSAPAAQAPQGQAQGQGPQTQKK